MLVSEKKCFFFVCLWELIEVVKYANCGIATFSLQKVLESAVLEVFFFFF